MYLLKILAEYNLYTLNSPFYYCSDEKIDVGTRVYINFNENEILGFVIESAFKEEDIKQLSLELGYDLKYITKKIDDEPIINEELFQLSNLLSKRYFYPLIGVLQTILPKTLRPKKESCRSKISYDVYYKINRNNKFDLSKLTNNERKIILKFKNCDEIPKKNLCQSKSLKSLLDNNIIYLFKTEKYRLKLEKIYDYEKVINLTDEQQRALDEYENSNYLVYLLYGVTGSGKTEVYIKIIEKALESGKTALILVPEIALTPLMISRILSYFCVDIAVLHSSLTESELYDEYRKIKQGKAKIVIGTRSAIFAPLTNIGIIIIDEEHSDTYKENNTLCYDARDVAFIRASYYKCKVILGSATPSIESMSKAKSDVYKLLCLSNRYNNMQLAKIITIDRKKFDNFSSISQIFSLRVIQEIKLRLMLNEQTIIFINTKGYGRSVYCRECGYVFKCPHCDVNLTYYKEDNTLRCSHCGYKIKKPKKCPKCNSPYISFMDFGIQKVEEDFKRIFNVPYLVLDGDRTPKSLQITDVLNKFSKKESLVLIGTQIVSKGHDFGDVTLVVVMNADSLLSIPTYRASENAFDLITQTIGRSGRSNKEGIAIIQTSFANNYAIKYAIESDYIDFYKAEIQKRQLLKNPPFYKIIGIEVISKNPELSYNTCLDIRNYFLVLKLDIILNDVTYPYWFKGNYKAILYLKCKKISNIQDDLLDLINIYNKKTKVKIKINVNPIDY